MSSRAMVPPMKAVAMEQLRVVGLALRREALLLCAGLVVFAVALPFFEAELTPDGRPFVVDPGDFGYVAVWVGLLAPLGVWKGERFFGESPLWTVPVDHARHARLKIFAGWLWLMAVVVFGLMMLTAGTKLTGGTVGVDETRLLVVNPELGPEGPRTEVRWMSPLWQWMLPFTVATAGYLGMTAFLVGLRRPVVWGGGIWLLSLGVISLSEENIGWATETVNGVSHALNLLVSGGSESIGVLLDSGRYVRGWIHLPDGGGWAAGTAMWLGLALVAVWAATSRHRER